MSKEEVKRINDQGMAAWNSHSADAFVALFADNLVWKDVGLAEPLRTKDAVRQYFQAWMTAFPDMVARTTNVLLTDDALAVELEWTGTHKGPLQGPPGAPPVPPTGKKVAGKGAFFAKVRNGKVVEFSAHPDIAGMLMQLGLVPPPPGAKK